MNQFVTEVNISLVKPKDGLVGFASFVLFEAIYCGSVAIYSSKAGTYRLCYPNRLVGGRGIDIFYPINQQIGEVIKKAVLREYDEVMSKLNVRHYSA